MTITQQRKILTRITECEKDISELKRVRQEILSSGYASASISSNGGSKSYTRADADKITKAIINLQKELYQLNALLRNAGTDPFEIKKILHVYC